IERLRALGYIAGDAATDDRPEIEADWMHTNSIDYNEELDQILLSSRHFSEIWIIDHGTTTEAAAGHTGGRYGKGGDLLYRWGNPEVWGAGGPEDRRLFVQHDARWIEEGVEGAGNILVFNNGAGRSDINYSSVLEIAAPINAEGAYVMAAGEPTGPDEPVWEYTASERQDMFSAMLSGAQRLPNGNTLIALGQTGQMLEVGAGNAVVWEFTNPYLEDQDRLSSARIAAAFGGREGGEDGRPPAEGGRGGPRRGPPPKGVGGRAGDDPAGLGRDRGPGGGRGPEAGRGPGLSPGPGDDGGPGGAGSIFRATRIPIDHPGLPALRERGESPEREGTAIRSK
ncbi:MAG: aryl-sulfate sulfotransferase, partial [Deltaproteobacteria bacterium]|nr:aryl-sulfate sulfotransferase [Deltaproteobacteria bacterium]MBW2530100.1 aryl-sulfate sulfotransferase [Deltaproteobacteria bacterium]